MDSTVKFGVYVFAAIVAMVSIAIVVCWLVFKGNTSLKAEKKYDYQIEHSELFTIFITGGMIILVILIGLTVWLLCHIFAARPEDTATTLCASLIATMVTMGLLFTALLTNIVHENKRRDDREKILNDHELDEKRFIYDVFIDVTRKLYDENYGIRFSSLITLTQWYETQSNKIKCSIVKILLKYLSTPQPDLPFPLPYDWDYMFIKNSSYTQAFQLDASIRQEIVIFLSKIAEDEAKKYATAQQWLDCMDMWEVNKWEDKNDKYPWAQLGKQRVSGKNEKKLYLSISAAQLYGINLEGQTLTHLRFVDCVFSEANIKKAQIKNAWFEKTYMNYVNCDGSQWEKTICRFISFDHAQLSDLEISECEFCYVFFLEWDKKKVIELPADSCGSTVLNSLCSLRDREFFDSSLSFSFDDQQYLFDTFSTSKRENAEDREYREYSKEKLWVDTNYAHTAEGDNRTLARKFFCNSSVVQTLWWGCSFDGIEMANSSDKYVWRDNTFMYCTFYHSRLKNIHFEKCEFLYVAFDFALLYEVTFKSDKENIISLVWSDIDYPDVSSLTECADSLALPRKFAYSLFLNNPHDDEQLDDSWRIWKEYVTQHKGLLVDLDPEILADGGKYGCVYGVESSEWMKSFPDIGKDSYTNPWIFRVNDRYQDYSLSNRMYRDNRYPDDISVNNISTMIKSELIAQCSRQERDTQ